MKNVRKKSVIIILILIIVLFFLLKDDFNNVINTLLDVNLIWIAIAIIAIMLYWLLKTLGLYILVREQNEKIKFRTIFAQGIITEFFNGITPFATGGQPMQVYMLTKTGIKVANATNMIVQSFIFFQTALLVHGILAVTLNYMFNLVTINTAIWTLIMLGFIMNTIVGIALLFISFSTRVNNKIGKLIINIGFKFKLIKNKKKALEKWEEKLKEYHSNAELLRNKKSLFIKGFICNFIALFFLYIIPLFIVYSLRDYTSINIVEAIITSACILLIGNFVPIPGGSGGIEYGFMNIFKTFIQGTALTAVLMLWRFVTYYLGIIAGAIIMGFFKGEDKLCE